MQICIDIHFDYRYSVIKKQNSRRENKMTDFQVGKTVEMFGSQYFVKKLYALTDAEMETLNLYHRVRVTLIKVSGENGCDTMDFAVTE